MYYFLTPTKDATLYRQQPEQNTGLDQVLEVGKVYYGTNRELSRSLIQFDIEGLKGLIDNGDVVLEDAKLILYETESEEIALDYTIYAYPVSESWEMGIGTRFDDISMEGVSWYYRNGGTKLEWTSGSDGKPTVGGKWIEDVYATQSFSYQTADVAMDVKDVVYEWITGSIDNYGFIVKHPTNAEKDGNDYGMLKFFSKETNTVYQPKLQISWDDQIFTTGSMLPIEADDNIKITLRNFKKQYKADKRTRINISARELYPLKTFDKPFPYDSSYYLPETTYYKITDAETETTIVPFSEASKVSCDNNGNFIILDFTNWNVNRFYKLEFRVEVDGNVFHYDNDDVFEVIR